MAKKYCRAGQRLDAIVADLHRQVTQEARKLTRSKRPDPNTSLLMSLKSEHREAKKDYTKHARQCDTCEE